MPFGFVASLCSFLIMLMMDLKSACDHFGVSLVWSALVFFVLLGFRVSLFGFSECLLRANSFITITRPHAEEECG